MTKNSGMSTNDNKTNDHSADAESRQDILLDSEFGFDPRQMQKCLKNHGRQNLRLEAQATVNWLPKWSVTVMANAPTIHISIDTAFDSLRATLEHAFLSEMIALRPTTTLNEFLLTEHFQ